MISITPSTPVARIHALFPESAEIFAAYGLHCFGCSMEGKESLAEGCAIHKMNKELMEELIDDLLTAAKKLEPRPKSIAITDAAALEVQRIVEEAGVNKDCHPECPNNCRTSIHSTNTQCDNCLGVSKDDNPTLRVVLDRNYQFCLELTEQPEEGERMFEHTEIDPPLCIAASEEILFRIGGSTIDIVNGRLKINLPEPQSPGSTKCCNS